MLDTDDLTEDHPEGPLAMLSELDTLDRQRATLGRERALLLNQLMAKLGINRKALAAFLARRKLSAEERAHWDASLAALCTQTGLDYQPDLFDLEADEPPIRTPAPLGMTH